MQQYDPSLQGYVWGLLELLEPRDCYVSLNLLAELLITMTGVERSTFDIVIDDMRRKYLITGDSSLKEIRRAKTYLWNLEDIQSKRRVTDPEYNTPKCPICLLPTKGLVKHHISYEPEEVVFICQGCHIRIHRQLGFMWPPIKDWNGGG